MSSAEEYPLTITNHDRYELGFYFTSISPSASSATNPHTEVEVLKINQTMKGVRTQHYQARDRCVGFPCESEAQKEIK